MSPQGRVGTRWGYGSQREREESPSPQGRVGTAHSTVKGTSEGKVAVPSRSGRDPTPRSWEFLIRLSRRPLKVGSGPTFAVGGSPSLFRSPSPQGRVGTEAQTILNEIEDHVAVPSRSGRNRKLARDVTINFRVAVPSRSGRNSCRNRKAASPTARRRPLKVGSER